MSIVIYCLIQNSIQSQLKSGGWHQEVQPLRLFKQDLLKEGLTDMNLLSPAVHYFSFWSMFLCSHLPFHLLEFWSLPWLQSLQSSQCQRFSCPMREGTVWQEMPTGAGEGDSRGYSPFAEADLSCIWPGEGLRFQPVYCTLDIYISYPSGGTVVFNTHPSPHWEVSKIRPTRFQPTTPFPVAGIIQGPPFHLAPETRPSKPLGYEQDLSTSGP